MRVPFAGRAGRLVRGGVGVLAFLALAEAVGRSSYVDPEDVPPPSAVFSRLADLAAESSFWQALWITSRCWLGGLAIGVAIAVPLGVLLGSVPGLNAASRALIEFLRPIPSIAIVPAVILVLGIGTQMRLFVVAYAVVWPVLFNTIYGLMEVDPLAKETARSFGFGWLATQVRIALVSAAPFVMTGVRLAAGVGLIVEVGVELIASSSGGLGQVITDSQAVGNEVDLVLAVVFVAGLLGFAANLVLESASRRAFGWSTLVERT